MQPRAFVAITIAATVWIFADGGDGWLTRAGTWYATHPLESAVILIAGAALGRLFLALDQDWNVRIPLTGRILRSPLYRPKR